LFQIEVTDLNEVNILYRADIFLSMSRSYLFIHTMQLGSTRHALVDGRSKHCFAKQTCQHIWTDYTYL